MSRKESEAIIRRLKKDDRFRIEQSRGTSHWKVYDKDNRLLTVISGSPSDFRAIAKIEAILGRMNESSQNKVSG